METHTGLDFTGAGTPTSAGGGYVYMRNRWYDPQTGRFLSQDPIGLAGGVNLYAYAGNNPASYSDPFGLCPGKEKSGTICIAFYIRSRTTLNGVLAGDDRGPSAYSNAEQSRAYVIVDPSRPDAAHPQVNKSCYGFTESARSICSPANDRTNTFKVKSDGHGGFKVSVAISNSLVTGPAINAELHFTKGEDGAWSASGTRDGYPSLEAYYYGKDGSVQTIVNQEEGKPHQLWGCCDKKVP
jgi:RHS repeat-associated protein